MFITKIKTAASCLLAFGLLTTGLGIAWPSTHEPTAQASVQQDTPKDKDIPAGNQDTPGDKKEPVGLSKAEFDKLLKQLNLKNQAWATIPWKNTLPEARAQAIKENKPIFMVVNTGNCLGLV